jgi:tRNA 2-thiouridine synthesizing protein A
MDHINTSTAAVTGTDDYLQTQQLLADLQALRHKRCAKCSAAICGHATLMSLVVGCKDQPLCLNCLALQMGRNSNDLRDRLLSYIRIRPCRLAGWEWANRAENVVPGTLPGCMWPEEKSLATRMENWLSMTDTMPTPPFADAEWDAGDLGCGELVMGLRQRLMAMQPGGVLKLTATDAGMPADLPAWCGMTGHTLVLGTHPEYWIQRREN